MARKKKMTVADAADKITKRLGQLDKAPGTTYDKNAVAAEKEILEKKLQQLQAYNEQKRMEEERMAMMNSMYSNPMMAADPMMGMAAMGGYTKKRYQLGGPPTFDQWKTNNLADWYIRQTDPAQLQQEYNDWLSSNYITPEGGDVAGYSENLMDRMDYMPTETQTVSVENNPNYGEINPETGKLDLNPSVQTMEGTDFTKVPEKDIYKVDRPQGTEEEREMLENSGLPPTEGGQGFDWGEAGYQAARLAPAAYNLVQGLRKPAQEEAYTNPYAQDILASMRNRKFNIQPQIEAAKRVASKTNKDILSASGGNAATYLGNVGASGRGYFSDVASLYGKKQNIEHEWQNQFSEMAATLGYQEALARERQRERELQNLAAKRNFLGTAATQLSQIAQWDRFMEQAKEMDTLRAGTLQGAYFKYNPEIGGYEFIGG